MSNGMKPIDPANVFTDRTLAPFTTKKGRTVKEVVKRMKAGAKEEREKEQIVNNSVFPLTVGACNFDFPSKLPDDVILTNNWNPLMPENMKFGCPPKKSLSDIDIQEILKESFRTKPKGIEDMSKEQPNKLDRIKGLIEGFQLAVGAMERQEGSLLNGTDLLEKILQVIEE